MAYWMKIFQSAENGNILPQMIIFTTIQIRSHKDIDFLAISLLDILIKSAIVEKHVTQWHTEKDWGREKEGERKEIEKKKNPIPLRRSVTMSAMARARQRKIHSSWSEKAFFYFPLHRTWEMLWSDFQPSCHVPIFV